MPRLPYIPETITVHLGRPEADAPNVTLPFLDYIANVASSEIYPTCFTRSRLPIFPGFIRTLSMPFLIHSNAMR